ncbi:MAG: B12-binding domain-containing radical SAM protein [Euryarchaeota archaeon]|nr:B12-binding domain-containing radical SAM protein [Euryarchaeota archaeon]
MKVLLIHPPCEEEIYQRFLGLIAPPIGLAYVAAMLEREHEVKIIDMPAERKDIAKVKKEIELFKPGALGVYCATYRVDYANQVINATKEVDANIRTMMGGPHASLLAEDVLARNPNLDAVVCGEGEITVPELIHAWESGELAEIRGMVFRENGHVVRNPPRPLIADLDSLPYPARHLLPMDKYRLFGAFKMGTIVSSRGCPHGCHYCSVPAIYGRKWRARGAENVVDEMECLCDNYDPDLIMFFDDNFDLDKKRTESICDEIMERGLEITWGYESASMGIDRKHLKKLRDAGCRILSYGIETTSNKSIATMKKSISTQEIREVMETSKDLGMLRIANIILGLPGESKEDVEESIELAKELNPEYPLFFLPAPYPGTKFYETAQKMGMIKELDWSKYTTANPIIETQQLSLDEVRELNRKAYKEFYLRPGAMKNNLRMAYDFIKCGIIKPRHIPGLAYHQLKTFVRLVRL